MGSSSAGRPAPAPAGQTERARAIDQRAGEDVGDDQVVGRAVPSSAGDRVHGRRRRRSSSWPRVAAESRPAVDRPPHSPRATSIATGSMSEAIARAAGHSRIAAKASRPVPVPMSARLATLAPRRPCSRSSAIRQPVVVSCWPVPKARPASISKRDRIRRDRVAMRGRVDEEAAGADRLEPGLAERHPIARPRAARPSAPRRARSAPARASRATCRRARAPRRNRRPSAIRPARRIGLAGHQHRRRIEQGERAISPVSASASARVQGRLTFQLTPPPACSADKAGAIDVDHRAGRRGRRVDAPASAPSRRSRRRSATRPSGMSASDLMAAAACDIILDHAGAR